jgi:hypothetical protein
MIKYEKPLLQKGGFFNAQYCNMRLQALIQKAGWGLYCETPGSKKRLFF